MGAHSHRHKNRPDVGPIAANRVKRTLKHKTSITEQSG